METQYFDPMFYISSVDMPFTIRIEIKLNEKIDKNILQNAVNKIIKRFPYFSIRVKKIKEEYVTEYNDLPIVVYEDDKVYALGSEEVNFHMIALSCKQNQINFYASHTITDGGGSFPFVKSVLYYYLTEKTGKSFSPNGFYLTDTPFFSDETVNPYPEQLLENAKPFFIKKNVDCFRLIDGGYIKENEKGRVLRFKIPLKETMAFSFDNDGSPNALLSSLMAKAIWKVHPDISKSIISAVSFNMRGGLKNMHNYRLLSSALKVEYPCRLKDESILKVCTCTRGTISLQSQPENVLFEGKMRKELYNKISHLSLEEKKEYISKKALADAINNTFSISYVGKVDYGELTPYIKSDYNITDGSSYKTVFIEIGAVDGWFTIAFIQGFESEVYYKALVEEIEKCNIPVYEEEKTDLLTPKIILP